LEYLYPLRDGSQEGLDVHLPRFDRSIIVLLSKRRDLHLWSPSKELHGSHDRLEIGSERINHRDLGIDRALVE
jgi:hypothetical protein